MTRRRRILAGHGKGIDPAGSRNLGRTWPVIATHIFGPVVTINARTVRARPTVIRLERRPGRSTGQDSNKRESERRERRD